VARGFWESAEHRGIQVDLLYETYLHRSADAAGRQAWVDYLMSGRGEADAIAGFLLSDEYQAREPDTSLVTRLYRDVFGREPDAEGARAWSAAVAAGLDRAGLVAGILSSAEAFLRLTDVAYSDFLHRPADPAGQGGWVAALLSGRSRREDVQESIIASDEYFSRSFER
jgi:hypothetical protein